MTNTKPNELTVGDVAAVTTSALSGMVIGIKAGAVIGALFGPFGLAVGPLIGAVWSHTAFMNRSMQSAAPGTQAAKDAMRLAVGPLLHPAEHSSTGSCGEPDAQ